MGQSKSFEMPFAADHDSNWWSPVTLTELEILSRSLLLQSQDLQAAGHADADMTGLSCLWLLQLFQLSVAYQINLLSRNHTGAVTLAGRKLLQISFNRSRN